MNFLLTIFFLLLIINVLVFVHELGHFLSAKLSGVEVKEFALGFGKNLITRHYKGTDYKVNLLPFGGYVQLEGENESLDENSFRNKPLKVKTFVLLAGVTMNLILAVILLGGFLASNEYKFAVPNLTSYTFNNTDKQYSLYPLTITDVDLTGPSYNQLFAKENIIGVNGKFFSNYTEFQDLLKQNQSKQVEMEFFNLDTYNITSREIQLGKEDNGAVLKVKIAEVSGNNNPVYFIKYNSTLTSGVSMTYDFFIYQLKALGSLIKNAISSGNYTEISQSVGGLPTIGDRIGQAVTYQSYTLLIPLTALFSINLAMLNILPFPALDGGQLFIAILEKVFRKKIPDNILEKINLGGFLVLMGIGLIVTFKDIIQLNWIGNIGNFFKTILGK